MFKAKRMFGNASKTVDIGYTITKETNPQTAVAEVKAEHLYSLGFVGSLGGGAVRVSPTHFTQGAIMDMSKQQISSAQRQMRRDGDWYYDKMTQQYRRI